MPAIQLKIIKYKNSIFFILKPAQNRLIKELSMSYLKFNTPITFILSKERKILHGAKYVFF